MPTITATWPDGDALIWRDGALETVPASGTPKRLHLEAQTGPWAIGEIGVQTEDWPSDPYAFVAACEALSANAFPPPSFESEGELPAVGPGGLVFEAPVP